MDDSSLFNSTLLNLPVLYNVEVQGLPKNIVVNFARTTYAQCDAIRCE